MSEVKAFTAEDIFYLEKQLNDFNKENQVFATQVFHVEAMEEWGVYTKRYECLVYYEPLSKNSSPEAKQMPTNHIKKDTRPKNPLSSSQLSALKSAVEERLYNESKFGKIENLSKQEAFIIIRDLKEGNFKYG